MARPKDKGGRPTKYLPSYCDKLVSHMTQGLSFESFAAVIGVGANTLYEWEKRHKRFREAHQLGRAAALRFWEEVGKAGMIFGEMHVTDPMTGERSIRRMNFKSSTWKFWMQARFGWSEKIEVTNPGGAENQDEIRKQLIEAMRDPDAAAALAVLNKKLTRKPEADE